MRKLRRSIAAVYYEVYKAAIKRALQEQAISPILRMFFDFGFMDSGLLGEEYTEQLYAVAERLSECNSEHVYTMYTIALNIIVLIVFLNELDIRNGQKVFVLMVYTLTIPIVNLAEDSGMNFYSFYSCM